MIYLLLLVAHALAIVTPIRDTTFIQGVNSNIGEAVQFLREYEAEASSMCYRVALDQWNYATNLTDSNKKRMVDSQALQSKLERVVWQKATSFAWSALPDPLVRKQLRIIASRGRSSLSEHKQYDLQQVIQDMKDIFNRARTCPYSNSVSPYCDLRIEPDLVRTMAHSRNYEEQLHTWKSWRDAVGPKLRGLYARYVELANEAASLMGYRDAGEQEREIWGIDDLKGQIGEVWSSIAPLYRQLHTYVRSRLRKHYAPYRMSDTAPIPAHLLGNMWAQNWKNIIDLVLPFPGKRRIDVTAEMLRQGYNPLRMVQTAEEYFTSLGLKPMPVEFWRNSMIERPNDRAVTCKASAWDFCNRRDYRLKMCTDVSMEDLLVLHHEMTHLQYYLQYADQPYLFRNGANPAFHEALSDAIGLSVQTPRHLHRIGLLNNITDDYETEINFLMEMALEKVAYIPFSYIVDLWRWRVFSEGTREMNSAWWELRVWHQGILPPVPRSERDFDPASKYHIISDQPYIKYFMSLILQFQIFESLCQSSGHIGTLHTCDIYRSREAGRLLSEIMAAGSSKPWSEVLRIATRGATNKLDARPLLEYFKPLLLWLRVANRDEKMIGWVTTDKDEALYEQWSRSSTLNVPATTCIISSCAVILISFILNTY